MLRLTFQDGIYLYNKYGKPVSWDTWTRVRKMLGMCLGQMTQHTAGELTRDRLCSHNHGR